MNQNSHSNWKTTKVDLSLSLTADASQPMSASQRIALFLVAGGLLAMLLGAWGGTNTNASTYLWLSLVGLGVGGAWYAYSTYQNRSAGIKNNGNFDAGLTARGALAWVFAVIITGFYVLLYWFPHLLGFNDQGQNTGLVRLFDPLSYALKGQAASQWFVYGTLYTLAIWVMGFKFILKYRHNTYQVLRTLSVMFFQMAFAFLIPEFLQRLNLPYYDFKNSWPLNYYFFFDWNIQKLLDNGTIGLFMLGWGVALAFIISPILTYFFGKRWYCSWVCGCGGLAETAGDPFRHQSDKSLKAWKVERWLIHSVLVFAVLTTSLCLYTFFTKQSTVLFMNSNTIREAYGFWIGALFSGVVGVGFYPIMGSRVWCRFGCPMAAYLGILQKYFSRFRITTNGGQCISCGNCSTYCEMGIDVKAYAQQGQNIVRASCVGCGVCAAVCPRGVLKLENGDNTDFKSRTEHQAITLGNDGIRVNL